MSSGRLNLAHVVEPLLDNHNHNETKVVLVTDSVAADGRDTATALKKLRDSNNKTEVSYDLPERQPTSQNSNTDHNNTTIRSIPTLLEEQLLLNPNETEDARQRLAQRVWDETRGWCLQNEGRDRAVVIVDDVSVLCSILGEQVTYRLMHSLAASLSGPTATTLIVRASNSTEPTTIHKSNGGRDASSAWSFSAGYIATAPPESTMWESCLVELCDIVMDVLPLQSGYSRDAYGRLIVTKRRGGSTLYNYVLLDSSVQVTAMDRSARSGNN